MKYVIIKNASPPLKNGYIIEGMLTKDGYVQVRAGGMTQQFKVGEDVKEYTPPQVTYTPLETYRFLVDVPNAKIKIGDTGEGKSHSKAKGIVFFTTINGQPSDSILKGLSGTNFQLGSQVEKVGLVKTSDTSTTKDASEKTDKVPVIASILSLAGLAGGIYYAYKNKKGGWAYVGYGLLGSIAGGIVGNIASAVIKPK